MANQLPIRRALFSTSDKSGIVELAQTLVNRQVEILATGGTAKLLQAHNIAVTEVASYTGFPEIMDGRVKTLHPKIHGGLLGRRGKDDADMQKLGIKPIDLLVVNLYPFQETISQNECTLEEAIEQIDIGGPCMLRSAAKNFHHVTVLIDPTDYSKLIDELEQHNGTTLLTTRQRLSQKAFSWLAQYNQAIADYLSQPASLNEATLPQNLNLAFSKKQDLRYGENPHQQAALYYDSNEKFGLANAKQLQGKPLSFNNLIDAECAFQACLSFPAPQPVCVIVKHATPCGIAVSDDPTTAYTKAFSTDPQSAFGGIIAFNTRVTQKTLATIISQQFVEVIIAPGIEESAKPLLAKKPNLRFLIGSIRKTNHSYSYHTISGGLLIQTQDHENLSLKSMSVVTQKKPTSTELEDLIFAWRAIKYVKSNAILYAKKGMTLGIGCGQTSRVFAAEIAALKATAADLSLQNAVMASDAFMPFADNIAVAAKNGISAIIQPGGSKRDNEVIAAADEANIAMVFTGVRHFRH